MNKIETHSNKYGTEPLIRWKNTLKTIKLKLLPENRGFTNLLENIHW